MIPVELSPTVRSAELQQDDRASYSHPSRTASRCGHSIHPSASTHTPWCPDCVVSQSRAKLDAAQLHLGARGGTTPARYMRDRRWNQARLKHDIAKQQLQQARKEDQLRWERERAWNEAHKTYDTQQPQAAVAIQNLTACPVCASLAACSPTEMRKVTTTMSMTWWERPEALAIQHTPVSRMARGLRKQSREPAYTVEASEALRKTIKELRASIYAADARRRTWEARYKTESTVRRKYSLGEGFSIDPSFWNMPISGVVSLRNFQQVQETRRSAERRARGNTPRPKPPRSSLSQTELSEELDVDNAWIAIMKEKEELEELEREARKVGEEVGYLYFVGAINGMEAWEEDVLRSDRQLVVRTLVPSSETSSSEEVGDDETDDNDFDEMDVDES